MSVTLTAAQHVAWKVFQKIRGKAGRKGIGCEPSLVASELFRATSKTVAVVNKLEELETLSQTETAMLASSLSTVLYKVFVLAAHYNLNLEETFMQTLNDQMLESVT